MSATIRLTVLTGPHKGQRFCMRGTDAVLLGRSSECEIQLCGTARDRCVSRRHCQLAMETPFVRVTDLGSINGTFINGAQVMPGETPAVGNSLEAPLGCARDGDILTVGGTSVQIHLMDCHLPDDEFTDASSVRSEHGNVKENCPVEC